MHELEIVDYEKDSMEENYEYCRMTWYMSYLKNIYTL